MDINDLYKAIGDMNEKTLEKPRSHAKIFAWSGAIAAVLAISIGISCIFPGKTISPAADEHTQPTYTSRLSATLLSHAQYPQMAHYPEEEHAETQEELDAWSKKCDAWNQSIEAQRRPQGYAKDLNPFFEKTMCTFLSEENQKNKLCSPVNIYMALGMLSEITDGESRQEILDVLGKNNREELRKQASDVWNAQYRNDGATYMILANSLWLNDGLQYQRDTLETLSSDFYASSYSGVPGSPELDLSFQNWLNEETGGLLNDQIQNIKLTSDMVITLASALRYQAKWQTEFWPEQTKSGIFHGPKNNVESDFMHRSEDMHYFWGEHFGAVCLPMEAFGGGMWLILPDEGFTPEQLSQDEQVHALLETPEQWQQNKNLIVNLSMPKFDVCADMDLKDGLKEMGIRQVFDMEKANFDPLLKNPPTGVTPFLSKCSHAVRVMTDEEGVTAASFVEMEICGACEPPTDKIDFVLDRPFLFVIQSADGLPLFSGVVNEP